jgi:hypothetical protein
MEPVKKIRIVLADMPAMLVDIITEIIALEPDLTVVDSISDSTQLKAAVGRARADVVITQSPGHELAADSAALLFTGRPLKIIAITDNARQGLLCELRPHCEPLEQLSAEGLVAAIRAAARSTE